MKAVIHNERKETWCDAPRAHFWPAVVLVWAAFILFVGSLFAAFATSLPGLALGIGFLFSLYLLGHGLGYRPPFEWHVGFISTAEVKSEIGNWPKSAFVAMCPGCGRLRYFELGVYACRSVIYELRASSEGQRANALYELPPELWATRVWARGTVRASVLPGTLWRLVTGST